MTISRGWRWTGVVVLAAVAVWALVARTRATDVDVAAVSTGPLSVTVDEAGTTRVRSHADVNAPVAGRWVPLAIQAGDAVRAGALLGNSVSRSTRRLGARAGTRHAGFRRGHASRGRDPRDRRAERARRGDAHALANETRGRRRRRVAAGSRARRRRGDRAKERIRRRAAPRQRRDVRSRPGARRAGTVQRRTRRHPHRRAGRRQGAARVRGARARGRAGHAARRGRRPARPRGGHTLADVRRGTSARRRGGRHDIRSGRRHATGSREPDRARGVHEDLGARRGGAARERHRHRSGDRTSTWATSSACTLV